jgi:hypothetical protein
MELEIETQAAFGILPRLFLHTGEKSGLRFGMVLAGE